METKNQTILFAIILLGIITPRVMSSDELWVATFSTGEIWKVDTATGKTRFVAKGTVNAEDAVVDCNGILYYGGMFTGVRRFDTNTEKFLPRVGINVVGPEGPVLQTSTGDLFVNTRRKPGDHTGIWRILGGNDPVGVDVVPPFGKFGEGTAFLTSGPYAGDLVAVDSDLRRLVRSSPPDFGKAVTFIPETDPVSDKAAGVMVRPSDGHVFVANVTEPFGGRITEFSPEGEFYSVFYSTPTRSQAGFGEFDAKDNLYITVTPFLSQQSQIQKIRPDGSASDLGEMIPMAVGIAIKPNPFCSGLAP